MINKKAQYTVPSWMLAVILVLIILGILLFFIFGPYKEKLASYVQESIITPLQR